MRKHANQIAANVVMFIALNMLIFGCASQPSVRDTRSQPVKDRLVSLQSISARETEDTVDLEISADGPLTYSSLKQPDPPAVVLYIPQTNIDALPPVKPIGMGPLLAVSVSNGANNHTARMEIGLLADTPYSARQEGSKIHLSFAKLKSASLSAADPVLKNTDAQLPSDRGTPQAEVTDKSISVGTGGANLRPSQKAGSVQPTTVNKVDFISEADGKSTLLIVTSQTVDYQLKKITPQLLQLSLQNTSIPDYQQRPLITTRFNSAVDRIVPQQPDANKKESIFSIDLREAVAFTTEQTENLLMIHFAASSIPPKPMEQANLPAWKKVMTAEDSEINDLLVQSPDSAGPAIEKGNSGSISALTTRDDAELQSLLAPRQKRYTGEKIALDFYETDIKNVFRILREVSGKNFAIDKDVTGKVTMTLDKPVPWDQVLDLVLRMNQLGLVKEGEIIRIATLETLKKEEDLRKAQLEALKKAREEIKALEPLVTKYIPVSYSSAGNEVKPHIEMILTKDRGSVSVDGKNNQIIITDTATVVRQAEEIIKRIDKVTAQVVIEAKVVEVSNTFSKNLGIDWNMSYGAGIIPGTGVSTSTDMAMNFPSSSGSSIGINFSRLSGVPFVLEARLNALETTGEGRILSSPKILTLDNKKARIKQGTEFAYLERDSAGGSSVKFKSIDLLLEVTPHVTPDNRISLTIYITKNDVASLTSGVPSVATNEAQTELLVNDGDTVVIGGIIKSTESSGKAGFPVLNRIPILGWLFGNSTDATQSNELLIFIMPRILQLEQAVAQTN